MAAQRIFSVLEYFIFRAKNDEKQSSFFWHENSNYFTIYLDEKLRWKIFSNFTKKLKST